MLFEKNNKADLLVIDFFSLYREKLLNLADILERAGCSYQSSYLIKLVDFANDFQIDKFKSEIRSSNMFGGAGSVYDVIIKDQNLNDEFNSEWNELLALIKKTKIINRNKFYR